MLLSLGPVLHVGPVGAGTAAKLVANSTLLGALAVLGEVVALGRGASEGWRRGQPTRCSRPRLWPLRPSGGGRRSRPASCPRRFALALGLKDAELISAAAGGLDLKVAEAVRGWFAEAVEKGAGEDDYSSILAHIASSAKY